MNITVSLAKTAFAFLFVVNLAQSADSPLVLGPTIPLKGVDGKLDHLAVDPKGMRLFVANKPNNTLDIVDLKNGKMIEQITGQGKVSGVDYAPDLDMIYVGNGAGVCNAFDGKNYKLVFSATAKGADNVHYHSGTQTVYVAHDGTLTALDATSGKTKSAIKLPGAPHGFSIDQKSGKIFVVLTKPSVIAVVDVAKAEVTEQFPMTLSDAGSPIARDEENDLLFVGCPKKGMVVVFDQKTGKEITGIKIPDGIDDIHFDAKRNRIYASCGDGLLVTIQGHKGKWEITNKIETPKFSRTCVFCPIADKLFLGVPKTEGKEGPEVRIFQASPEANGKNQ